ncbi:hypothetical protein [Pseudomonas mosselii]|uniref:Uncharacterized protein n=1 Tax=Pseudomonas mosselii TaxID=78327 RepID=A0A7W2PYL9_9PSED|nr:hypothetical protein [Pseudomonas mosselii]MBA6065676.1 hypothetical protein [Pseudomonas mosselii]
MINAVIKSRRLRAIGSVVDMLPLGDYSEYMPTEPRTVRIKGYWKSTGHYVGKAIEQYDQDARRRRIDADCQTA